MGKSKAPPAPDYAAAAKETAAGNLDAAKYATNANRINQITPYGSLNYTYQPQYDAQGKETGGGWTQTETLTPQAQAALDQQLALNQKYGDVANIGFDQARQIFENPRLNTAGVNQGATGLNTSSLPNAPQGLNMGALPGLNTGAGIGQIQAPGQTRSLSAPNQRASLNLSGLPQMGSYDFSALPQVGGINLGALPSRGVNAGQTAMQAIMSRLQPQLQQQEEALRTRLANQGIGLGSEAYQREQSMQGQRANDLQLQAAAQGISIDEMLRQNALNEQMQAGQFDLSRRGQMMGEQTAGANLANQNRQQMTNERLLGANFDRQSGLDAFGQQLQAAQFNQGAGNDAFNQQLASGQFDLARAGLGNDARSQAMQEQLSGVGVDSQLRQNALNEQMAAQGFNQNLRSQQLQEQAYLQDRPLNLINALRTGNQVQSPQFQQFSQQATTQGPDMLNAAQAQYQAAVAANNAKNAQTSGMLGGLMGLGMTAAGLPVAGGGSLGGNALGGLFSDNRLKTNIQAVGKLDNGLTVYSYRYKWGGPTQIGVMAQEVEQVNPSAVSEVGGYKMVDYGRL